MPDTELRQLLSELETTINTMDTGSTPARDKLSQLSSAIETHLNAHEKPETESLVEEIKTAVSEFESEHPAATSLLNNIATTLSSIGI